MCLLSKMAIVGIYSSNIMGVNYFHLTIEQIFRATSTEGIPP